MLLEITRPVQGGLRQERKLDVTANNLANISTTGFKGDILSFDQMFKAQLTVDHTQGPVRETGNKMDLALEDEGYFKVRTPFGTRYTRNGNFTINRDGNLVTQSGDTVLGKNGPLAVRGEVVSINEAGAVQVDGEIVDELSIVTFESLAALQKEGSSYFVYKGDPWDEIVPPHVVVKQGALEEPNITAVVEMTHMIDQHRMYESYQKILQSFDETDGKAINEVGKLT